MSRLLIVIDIREQDSNTIDTIIYDVIVYIVHMILMYKSVHCFNITSLDVSQKTCKPGSKVVQDSLSGRFHLGVL